MAFGPAAFSYCILLAPCHHIASLGFHLLVSFPLYPRISVLGRQNFHLLGWPLSSKAENIDLSHYLWKMCLSPPREGNRDPKTGEEPVRGGPIPQLTHSCSPMFTFSSHKTPFFHCYSPCHSDKLRTLSSPSYFCQTVFTINFV